MRISAVAQPSGKWWAIEVTDLDGGVWTQARRLDEVPRMAADAAACVLGVDPSEIEVTVTVEQGHEGQ